MSDDELRDVREAAQCIVGFVDLCGDPPEEPAYLKCGLTVARAWLAAHRGVELSEGKGVQS